MLNYTVVISSEPNRFKPYPINTTIYTVIDSLYNEYYRGSSEDKAYSICTKVQALANARNY